MDRKTNKNALKKALQMAAFILIALEALAFLTQAVGGVSRYLRMEIGNPVHQLIFAAVAVFAGGYTYFRECMKGKAETEKDPDHAGEEPAEQLADHSGTESEE